MLLLLHIIHHRQAGDRKLLLDVIPMIWNDVSVLIKSSAAARSPLLRKYLVKLIQRIGLACLPHRSPSWRYVVSHAEIFNILILNLSISTFWDTNILYACPALLLSLLPLSLIGICFAVRVYNSFSRGCYDVYHCLGYIRWCLEWWLRCWQAQKGGLIIMRVVWFKVQFHFALCGQFGVRGITYVLIVLKWIYLNPWF